MQFRSYSRFADAFAWAECCRKAGYRTNVFWTRKREWGVTWHRGRS